MQQPPDYVQKDANGQQLALRAWFDKLKTFLISTGFVFSKSDASLFVRVTDTCRMYVLAYVDDIIITGTKVAHLDSGRLHLSQQKYVLNLLE
ncbi:hypothetical protein EPI10_019940 [Gossypium australe]|uniref:Reverse transcriptase Ty1/copia-type domain-containing protein n=1 Tax=Gossypium australe TaxID=47621 RepID=A0A5B6WCV1_9ROSI|nr:hypothetical protein EPI10_019940 [Gossypium australe]